MKYILCLIVLMFSFGCYADTTGDSVFYSPDGTQDYIADVVNDSTALDHTHSYDRYAPRFEGGLGIDLIVYENADNDLLPNKVAVETKYDFTNENGSVYVVATYNLWDLLFGNK